MVFLFCLKGRFFWGGVAVAVVVASSALLIAGESLSQVVVENAVAKNGSSGREINLKPAVKPNEKLKNGASTPLQYLFELFQLENWSVVWDTERSPVVHFESQVFNEQRAPSADTGSTQTTSFVATVKKKLPKEERIHLATQRLYQAIATDVKKHNRLVVTTFVNLEYNGSRPSPPRNMYWGGGYGYMGFFEWGSRKAFYKKQFGHLEFTQVLSIQQRTEPVRVVIYEAEFTSPDSLRKENAQKTKLYVVNLAWRQGWRGLIALAQGALQGSGDYVYTTNDGITIDAISDARLMGFAGHNPLFDNSNYKKIRLEATRLDTVGVFAIGCQTGRGMRGVPVMPYLVRGQSVPLLFTNSFMSGEAYSFVALLEGLGRKYPLSQLVSHVNDTYQAFQNHHNNKAGRPFLKPEKLRFPHLSN